jgi:hypothetical protein
MASAQGLPIVPTATNRAAHRSQDPQDGADDQQDDPKHLEDPDPGEGAKEQQEQPEISTLLPPPPPPSPTMRRGRRRRPDSARSHTDVSIQPRRSCPPSTRGQPYRPDPAPVGPPIEDQAATPAYPRSSWTARSASSPVTSSTAAPAQTAKPAQRKAKPSAKVQPKPASNGGTTDKERLKLAATGVKLREVDGLSWLKIGAKLNLSQSDQPKAGASRARTLYRSIRGADASTGPETAGKGK